MKLLIIQNNITNQTALDNGIALLKTRLNSIGFNLDVTISKNQLQIGSVPFSNETVQNGYLPDPNVLAKYLAGYDGVLYVYDWDKISPKPTNPADNGNVMSIPCQWFDKYPEVFADFALHELCHLFFSRSVRSDRADTTHAYPVEFGQKQRYEYYLYLLTSLKDFWFKDIDATLIRVPNGKETPGEITVHNGGATFQCKTLELLKCIPAGTYTVKWTFSPRFMKWTYELQNVKGWTGVRLHSGNYAWGKKVDTEGCILLGQLFQDINGDGVADIINSVKTTEAFNRFMGGRTFTLTIK